MKETSKQQLRQEWLAGGRKLYVSGGSSTHLIKYYAGCGKEDFDKLWIDIKHAIVCERERVRLRGPVMFYFA